MLHQTDSFVAKLQFAKIYFIKNMNQPYVAEDSQALLGGGGGAISPPSFSS